MSLSLLLLLPLKVVATVTTGKYVYVSSRLKWSEARTHCQTSYTDLAPVNNEYDLNFLNKMVAVNSFTWIGLMRNTTDRTKWMWSGGAEVLKSFWELSEPNGITGGEDTGAIHKHLWADIHPSSLIPFFCYKVHAIRERMTWEEALQYCRKKHHDLASVASKTEMMLIETELRKDLSSRNIWIGLRFLAGEWLWVDGQPFRYESWGPLDKPICLNMDLSCGAIYMNGKKRNVVGDTLFEVNEIVGWNARNCNLKRHFLCY